MIVGLNYGLVVNGGTISRCIVIVGKMLVGRNRTEDKSERKLADLGENWIRSGHFGLVWCGDSTFRDKVHAQVVAQKAAVAARKGTSKGRMV